MVLIGVDPHKGSHTAVVVDRNENEVARLSVRADRNSAATVSVISSAAGLPP